MLKNICIAYPNFSQYSETFIHNHLKHLQPEFEYYGTWYPHKDKYGKNILSFPLNSFILRGIIKNSSKNLFYKLYTNQICNDLKEKQIKVILAEYGPTGCSLIDASKLAKIPLIVHFHGFDAAHYNTLATFKEKYKQLFSTASSIVVVSKKMGQNLIELGADKKKIFNIPYGVNLSLFNGTNPGKNAPTFIAVGRFTDKKAPHLTIKAFEIVHKKITSTKLIMIGDGEKYKECVRLVKRLNLESSVEFKGVLDHSSIIKELSKARAFVQHSIRPENGDMEGTPNSILEASSMCLPIVSTFHAGIPEAVLHNKTGFLVNEFEYKKMADYMLRLAEDLKLAGLMGKAGRKHMEDNYSLEKQIDKLKKLVITSINNYYH